MIQRTWWIGTGHKYILDLFGTLSDITATMEQVSIVLYESS